ncbi:MAG: hypothetical protein M1819_007337 [Sarea resinae]|nr:MAG: hypothetical protein M1819_007337 [Sarea resinae]
MSLRKGPPGYNFTTFHNVINGQLRAGETSYNGIDPATEEKLWDAPVAEKEDVDEAVSAAANAFQSWSKVPYEERTEKVNAWADRLLEFQDEISGLSRLECGKPEVIEKYELELSIRNLHADTAITLEDEVEEREDRTVITRAVPHGVVVGICPWNWPLLITITQAVPALCTGNCVIIKPSPFTPYTTLKLVEIGQETFPPGVLQVLGGDDRLGPWLTEHPGVHHISFTGSIATGRKVMAAAAQTIKRVTLELGGNDPMIICPDIDIQTVAPKVAWGAFRNSAQACVVSKRIYVHSSIYVEFLAAMVSATKDLQLGPLQNRMQYEKTQYFLDNCREKGYTFAIGGEMITEIGKGKGYFLGPSIIDNPPDDSRIVTEEPFGPIVPVLSYNTEEEAIRRANASVTGLAACVWSASTSTATRIGSQLEAGMVFINSFEIPAAGTYFSGHKQSGIGGEGGKKGLLNYCNVKVLHVMK